MVLLVSIENLVSTSILTVPADFFGPVDICWNRVWLCLILYFTSFAIFSSSCKWQHWCKFWETVSYSAVLRWDFPITFLDLPPSEFNAGLKKLIRFNDGTGKYACTICAKECATRQTTTNHIRVKVFSFRSSWLLKIPSDTCIRSICYK